MNDSANPGDASARGNATRAPRWIAGAAVLVWAGAELGRSFDYWRGALGLFVMLIMVISPSGLLGLLRKERLP